MSREINKIWRLATPYLKKGVRKNFIIHTLAVVRAVKLILNKEKVDSEILLPAAILHDVGWSKVPKYLQKSNNKKEQIIALKLHLKYSPAIIKKILVKLHYNKDNIKKVIDIVASHKFKNPKNINKRILIDADNLSEAFKKSFENDLKFYLQTRQQLYNYRKKNKFYTKTAKDIFIKEINNRIKEK